MAALPLLTSAEQHQLLVEWNNTQTAYPRDKTVHQLFEEQVLRTPDAIALILPELETQSEQCLTYQELNNRANRLAAQLQQMGVGCETFVALIMERSIEMIVAILAILKAGGVYVPLDPSYPPERLAFMLEDSCAPVLLTQSHLRDGLPPHQAQIVYLDAGWGTGNEEQVELQACAVHSQNLAYVNYTSGSTGRPKGVAIPHQAVLRLVFNSTYTPLDGNQVILQLAPISFDAATFEIWGALLHGSVCVLYPAVGIPDPRELGAIIQRTGITTLFLTTALFNTIIAEVPEALLRVKELLTGGEAISLPHICKSLTCLPDMELIHVYGPTESTTFSCSYRIPRQLNADLKTLPIGKPIANTQTYILDDYLQPVPIGVAGELYIGGDGLAREYLNRPDITLERFIPNPFSADPTTRLYKTGDQVRYLSDGNIEFIGRRDFQVKLRGFRIELGEIEAILRQHEQVADAIVILREDRPGDKALVAYVTTKGEQAPGVKQLKDYLRERVAEFMVPAVVMVLDHMPLSPTGKIDRRALPKPVIRSAPVDGIAPTTPSEQVLAEIWAGVLGIDRLSVEENFFELGGTSLLGLQMIARVQKRFNSQIRAVKLYQYPTIRAMARYLDQEQRSMVQHVDDCWATFSTDSHPTATGDIAIIGMVGRFPGADSVEELWHNLCAGIESTTRFTDAELDPIDDQELRRDPHYVPVKGIVRGAEEFDAAFFGISPKEAEVMDPQARVFLELAYAALENAGYTSAYNGLIGLYAGSGQNTYFERHICGRKEIIEPLGAFQTMLANEKDFVTTRASYKLNLTGPSVSISTACSTSLVAVIHAVQGLRSHQCDLALAGGISINTPQNTGYLHQEGGMLSPDGHCRPFDAKAQGTMFNNGVGIVVLKRVEDALREGDRIYATIKGVGINNDGSDKASFTAPSVHGQMGAIVRAYADANIHPRTISYIEAHGTATPLGDPIEVEALTQAFRTQTAATQFCAIGSIKGNVGHLVAAAGVTGLIKTALALYHRKILPSVNFESPNPEIDFANSPFYVNTQLTDWPISENPRRAGVSSFGVGGTNAHVVLEEAPIAEESVAPSCPYQLLLLSAKTETALEQATANLRTHLQQNPAINLADVAYTLQVGRNGFNYRRFLVCRTQQEAIADLEILPAHRSATRYTDRRDPEVVFMFPGQGAQYLQMGQTLYQNEPVFRNAIDRCAHILQPLLNCDLRQVLYLVESQETAAELLQQTVYTQPALFAVEYALAQLWQSWGVQPAAMIGHSIGEFVAACLAGVFSLENALTLVATRGRMMAELPPGAMLSVRLAAAEVEPHLSADLAIAAINGPALCVVSGPTAQIAQLQQKLEAAEVACKLLHTSHAFHSPMMESIIEPFGQLVRTVQLSPPRIPFVSTVTANWITNSEATDPTYWANHLRATVRFAEGVQTLWQQPQRVLLEVGPRTTAATLARQQATDLNQQIAISSLGSTTEDNTEAATLLQAMGQLWLAGVSFDWQSVYANEKRRRIPLPTYPFERKRYWIDPKPVASAVSAGAIISEPIQTTPLSPAESTHTSLKSLPAVSTPMSDSLVQRIIPLLKEVVQTTSGLEIANVSDDLTFLEMGLDSLSLTQVAMAFKKQFKLKITFRNLLEDYPNLATLAAFLAQTLPPDVLPAPESRPVAASTPLSPLTDLTDFMPEATSPALNGNGYSKGNENGKDERNVTPSQMATAHIGTSAIETLVAQQLQIMNQQLELLRQAGMASAATSAAPALPPTPAPAPLPPVSPAPTPTNDRRPGAKIEKTSSGSLTPDQQQALDRIIARYTIRTQESKRQTQEHRRYLADPRTVSGFCPTLKEMVYPIITDRSAGSKLWDVDGNEYVDLTNGFGLNFFGWNPDFVKEAVIAQMEKGIEIGPQTPLAGKVAKLISEFTGMERIAFCNTGSEAVMATLRLARTVTGRDLVATFTGDYHGTFDEVLYRPGPNLRTMPAAPGILPSMFENLLVLDYGTPESLEILRNRADELAAILVEPVRSRDPGLQPKEFLQDLRRLTEQSGTAYIFDEVVTGFRSHPGGAQAYFGVQADMATYGKVVGGGLPIGIVAGKAEYMDALDGGFWQYGDDSIPEVGVTFFAGTFVRHPMALAAAEAVLLKLKAGGIELQQSLTEKVDKFATHLNQHFERVGAPIKIDHFTSYFYISYPTELPYAQLLFYLLREKGVHIWDHRPCFFTLSHTDADIEFVTRAFKDSVAELQAIGFLPGVTPVNTVPNGKIDRNCPPQPGARLGKDPEGNPAWYIPDPNRPGKYLQVAGVT
ncbi:amino acid adenylation domain-containing protein [Leptolyngbya sp. NK1-12]|uniref:Amino acid adenylation domain-containing protein n=1 Tax=Leptolyngbya sp. NK1-12 TaxID=2547451 RepID=A0AA97ALW1_9CYAN|nr:amino acid adenylation domain-containing protein [Leptolyngbya sp. NK1-12]